MITVQNDWRIKMNEEKQIEEMAKDLARSIVWCDLYDDDYTVDTKATSGNLIAKGYRKESEVVAEVLAKVKECVKEYMLDKGLYLATVKHALNYAERIIKGE